MLAYIHVYDVCDYIHVYDVCHKINSRISSGSGKRVMIEGANAAMLDIDYGSDNDSNHIIIIIIIIIITGQVRNFYR